MNYKETISWLFNQLPMYQRVGKAAYKADLNNTKAILKALGNPEKKLKQFILQVQTGKVVFHILLLPYYKMQAIKQGFTLHLTFKGF